MQSYPRRLESLKKQFPGVNRKWTTTLTPTEGPAVRCHVVYSHHLEILTLNNSLKQSTAHKNKTNFVQFLEFSSKN
jgi:hypothetical protein